MTLGNFLTHITLGWFLGSTEFHKISMQEGRNKRSKRVPWGCNYHSKNCLQFLWWNDIYTIFCDGMVHIDKRQSFISFYRLYSLRMTIFLVNSAQHPIIKLESRSAIKINNTNFSWMNQFLIIKNQNTRTVKGKSFILINIQENITL